MDDLIYRNNSIAEENIDPHGRPATNKFEVWTEEIIERTDTGYADKDVESELDRQQRINEMDEVIKSDLE